MQTTRIGARWVGLWLLVIGLLMSSAALAQEKSDEKAEKAELPTVDQVIGKLDDLYRADSSHGTIEMTIKTDRGTRKLAVEQWTKGDEKALLVIREPAREAGTATLRNKDGLWNYAPRADRLIRIPDGLLSDNWMGSHFTNDDLMRETSFDDDYKTTLSWATEGGKRYLKATMKPKPDAPVVWQKIEYRLSAEEWLPVEARYYDDGEVVRLMTFSDVEKVGGRKLPTVMKLLPQTGDDKGESTTVEYKDIDFGVDVDNSMFSKRGLRRVAKRR